MARKPKSAPKASRSSKRAPVSPTPRGQTPTSRGTSPGNKENESPTNPNALRNRKQSSRLAEATKNAEEDKARRQALKKAQKDKAAQRKHQLLADITVEKPTDSDELRLLRGTVSFFFFVLLYLIIYSRTAI